MTSASAPSVGWRLGLPPDPADLDDHGPVLGSQSAPHAVVQVLGDGVVQAGPSDGTGSADRDRCRRIRVEPDPGIRPDARGIVLP